MALIGYSVLIACFTYIVYRSRGSTLSSLLKRIQGVPQNETNNGATSARDAHEGETEEELQEKDSATVEQKNATVMSVRTSPDVRPPPAHTSAPTPTPDRAVVQDATPQPPPSSTLPITRQPHDNTTPQQKASASQLMPPPPRPAPPSLRRLPQSSASSSLRVPTTGPLPNRLPPSRSFNSLAPTTAARLPTPGTGRQKVQLKPGHSPLDWAALICSGDNLAGVPHLQRVTPAELAAHNGRKGRPAWSAWRGKVYNVSPYLPFHPGGEGQLMRGAGKDAEALFMEAHPWVNWENMLGECLVGVLVEGVDGDGGLDEMD